MTSARAGTLARQFEEANAEMIAAVEASDDRAWAAVSSETGWPASFAAWHVADSHAGLTQLVQAIANEQPLPPLTRDMINQGNDQNFASHPSPEKNEVLDLLRKNGAAAIAALQGFTDEQLDRSVTLELFGGAPMTVQQIIERVVIDHPRSHLEGMKVVA